MLGPVDTTATPPEGSHVGDLFVFVASAGVSFGSHDTSCTDPRVITQLVTEPENGNPWPLKQGVAYGILTTLDPVAVSVFASDNSVYAYLATYRVTGSVASQTSEGDQTNTAPVPCVPTLAGGDIGILVVAANQGALSAAGWTADVIDQNLGIWHAEPEAAAHVYRGGPTEVEQWTALSIGISED